MAKATAPLGRALTTLLLASTLALAACGGAETEPATAADAADPYRRAVGGLGAGYLFQTHLSIGAIADLLGKRIYEPGEVEVLMDTAIGMGENVGAMLRDLEGGALGPADARAIAHMKQVNEMLSRQAEALRAFARDQSEPNAKRFATARQKTWHALRELLDAGHDKPLPRLATPEAS